MKVSLENLYVDIGAYKVNKNSRQRKTSKCATFKNQQQRNIFIRTILKYNLPKLIRKAVLPFQLEGLLYSDSLPV